MTPGGLECSRTKRRVFGGEVTFPPTHQIPPLDLGAKSITRGTGLIESSIPAERQRPLRPSQWWLVSRFNDLAQPTNYLSTGGSSPGEVTALVIGLAATADQIYIMVA